MNNFMKCIIKQIVNLFNDILLEDEKIKIIKNRQTR